MIGKLILRWALVALPKTRLFLIKALLFNLFGHQVSLKSKITGDLRIYGRGRICIGDNAWIGLGCSFYTSPDGDIVIENNCDIAPEVIFHTGSHNIGDASQRAGEGYSKSIFIRQGTWVGTRSTILAGADVGASCIVAASSLILGKVYSDNQLLAGQPAKTIRELP